MLRSNLVLWRRLSDKLLADCRKFMLSCNEQFGRGFIGELLVFRQLLVSFEKKLLGNNSIEYFGSSKKDYDIKLLVNNNSIEINAKGTTQSDKNGNPRWVRQHASAFADIKQGKRIIVKPKKAFRHNFFYIYVDINAWIKKGKARFFVVSDKEANKVFGSKFARHFNGKKARKNNSDDMWVEYKDIKRFRDDSLKRLHSVL